MGAIQGWYSHPQTPGLGYPINCFVVLFLTLSL